MSTETQSITIEQIVKASRAQIYQAFTNSSTLIEWLCDVCTAVPEPEGRIYMWWLAGYYTSGEFIKLVEDEKIVFTWTGRGEPGQTKVKVKLEEKDDGTSVSVTHSGFGSGEEWSETVKEYKKGWENGLENLASLLETGEDIRFVKRPMLGIGLNDFDSEVAERLGVPVDEGIRLDSVLDGMGAKAAGLQHDDVIVGMGGQPTTDFTSLANSLNGKRAGDEIEVEFYRGEEKKSVTMELSGRPIPEIPSSANALSEEVGKGYAETEVQLDEFFSGVTEEEASFKPEPGEWSAKETMVHMIQGERGWHTFITNIVGGHEPHYDDFGGNVQAVIDGTLAVYPTLNDLIAEWKRSNKETVEMIARLPDEFLARKGSYWRLAYNCLQSPFHFHSHLDQMRAAVEAARK
jgi:uncharacterized protein YndB with AHSA1/START domain